MSFVTDSTEFSPKLPVTHVYFELFEKSYQLCFRFCSRISDLPVRTLARVTKHFWLHVATRCSQAQFGIWGVSTPLLRQTHSQKYAPLAWTYPPTPQRTWDPAYPPSGRDLGQVILTTPSPREHLWKHYFPPNYRWGAVDMHYLIHFWLNEYSYESLRYSCRYH